MKSAIATVALLSSVANAITFTTPTDLHSASEATITWTTDASDPSTWSLFLVNTIFHNNFAIANPVNNSAGTLTLTLPAVPIEDGYTLQATQIGNNSQVFATSPTFAIAAPLSSSAVPSSTAASSVSGSAVVSGSGTSAAVTSLPSGCVNLLQSAWLQMIQWLFEQIKRSYYRKCFSCTVCGFWFGFWICDRLKLRPRCQPYQFQRCRVGL
ncbi:hypothetical protein BDY19DRAFT_76157 [Irpex rosettiformis]|uniref:Uncharacterized protein n=1 Tax=Irpex rosettiformis TaxID=378272 RepID=A0ACB8UM98_9APHY|nr:hypothetical protein BDY19DRAFT_76157 [Irpex rosettiformis]